MIEVSDVLTCLQSYADTKGYTAEQLQPFCERGLLWVTEKLRPDADKNSPLIAPTAAAMAHYRLFFTRLAETDKFEAYTAGDMTVRRNLEKELGFESSLLNAAIADASSILADGGFFCRGN